MRSDFDFGPFLWFGTEKTETDIYGPRCFELKFPIVLEAYKKCRQNNQICYRVGGTLVYKYEVSHFVIVCCNNDKAELYPIIETNSTTKYFIPPVPRNKVLKVPIKKQTFQSTADPLEATTDDTLEYQDMEYQDMEYQDMVPPTISKHAKLGNYRHEEITLAFYLPKSIELKIPAAAGEITDNKHDRYCKKYQAEKCAEYK